MLVKYERLGAICTVQKCSECEMLGTLVTWANIWLPLLTERVLRHQSIWCCALNAFYNTLLEERRDGKTRKKT